MVCACVKCCEFLREKTAQGRTHEARQNSLLFGSGHGNTGSYQTAPSPSSHRDGSEGMRALRAVGLRQPSEEGNPRLSRALRTPGAKPRGCFSTSRLPCHPNPKSCFEDKKRNVILESAQNHQQKTHQDWDDHGNTDSYLEGLTDAHDEDEDDANDNADYR